MREKLSALDESFLHLEQPGLPMHVAGLVVFDPATRPGGRPVSVLELRALMRERLHLLPRFRQSVRSLRFRRSEWEDARPDLGYHVRHARLRRPGGRPELLRLSGRLQERLLDRGRPLWQMTLIDGLPDGRQALFSKTHHAITDGVAGMGVARLLFDLPPGLVEHLPAVLPPAPAAPWMRAAQAAVGGAFLLAGGPLNPGGLFGGRPGPHRAFGMAALPMAEIRRLKAGLGGSVDDLLLALVATGLGDYLREDECEPPRTRVRAMVPVSSRGASAGSELGNQVSAMFVDLPLDSPDLATSLRRVAESKSVLRGAHEARGVTALIEAGGLLPAPVQGPLVRALCALPVTDLVVSDIPGPAEPLELLGARIEAAYPVMPLAPCSGLSIAALTLGGVMGLGVTSDPAVVADPDGLAAAIASALSTAARVRAA